MIIIKQLWSLPNRPLTTGLKNKLKPTFEIEQCWIFAVLWPPFWKWRPVDIFRCRESIQDVEIKQCWICVVLWWPFWKWRPVEIFRCQESIRDIIIYPHMKWCWNRIMLNLCGIVVAILKMATGRKIFNVGTSLFTHIHVYRTMLNFYHPFFMPCFGRHLENFENAELLL